MTSNYARDKVKALSDPDLIVVNGRLFYAPGPHNRNTYTNRGCRCEECRADHARQQRECQAARKARLAADPRLAPHGNEYTYTNWGCRCRPCTDAHSAAMHEDAKRRKARRAVS